MNRIKRIIARAKRRKLINNRKPSKEIYSGIDRDLLKQFKEKLNNRLYEDNFNYQTRWEDWTFFKDSPFKEFLNIDFLTLPNKQRNKYAKDLANYYIEERNKGNTDMDVRVNDNPFEGKTDKEIYRMLYKEYQEKITDFKKFANDYDFNIYELIDILGCTIDNRKLIKYITSHNREDLIKEYLNKSVTGKNHIQSSLKKYKRRSKKVKAYIEDEMDKIIGFEGNYTVRQVLEYLAEYESGNFNNDISYINISKDSQNDLIKEMSAEGIIDPKLVIKMMEDYISYNLITEAEAENLILKLQK